MEWTTEIREAVHEQESTDFSSSGQVRTADGKTIDFTLSLGMCRDYSCERVVKDSGSIELHDPLVINFDGTSAELSGKRFSFDLDSDGTVESIPELAAGHALLAFDGNNDGKIDNGNELFGTASGNGFSDLARFDNDGNHWIDESDTAYGTLRLWEHNSDGFDTLSTLADRGVGAIYLGYAETPFSLKDSDNVLQGQVRASGLYLREDGSAGSVQQVDLAV